MDASNYPCNYQLCVRAMGGELTPAPQNLPSEEILRYFPQAQEVGSIRWPSDVQLAIDTLERAASMQIHYDESGNFDVEANVKEIGEILAICAVDAGGACGVSYGASGSFILGGARGSVDIVVDSNGDIAVFATPGLGLYATPSIENLTTSGLSILVARGDKLDVTDMSEWAVQFGGSIKGVSGISAEWVVGKEAETQRPWHGVSVGSATGVGGELHGTFTYSQPIWDTIR